MPIDDDIRTTIRIPKTLHSEIGRCAVALGLSVNAEMTLRLAHNPHLDATQEIIAEIRQRDDAIVESLRKQMGALWSVLKRTDDVLESVASALSKAPGDGAPAELRREVEFARELIGTIGSIK